MKKPAILLLATTLFGGTLIGFSAFAKPKPWLVWNASASAPVGLYRVIPGIPERGYLALVMPPKPVAELAARRGYLPLRVPLIKRIAAVGGDDVCAFGGAIIVNGKVVVRQRKADKKGRPLPQWDGCRELAQDEIFLLTNAPGSFDSRYFGPVPRQQIVGRLAPVWTK